MSLKKIYKYEDIKDKILHAVDLITNPIAQTLSPRGGNCILEDDNGNQFYTNDGVTIARTMFVKDEIENTIIEIIKGGALKTNLEVGDGTSSTILLSSILIKEGLRLIENGYNQMDVRDELIEFSKKIRNHLSGMVHKVKSDEDIKLISKISSNNDEEIADNIVKILNVVGMDGQVLLEKGYSEQTEIIEDNGFVLNSGVFTKELADEHFQSNLLNVPVFVTDKRLYYKEEAETILRTALSAGYNEIVVIAKDFIGEALPYFVANHKNGKIRVALIVEKDLDILEDIAVYLGGEVISDKKGELVSNITIEDFMMSPRVYSKPQKSIIFRDKNEKNVKLNTRVKALKTEQKKNGNKHDPEYKKIKQRISSLTNGMVTIRVGGSTETEILERIYRYEDSVSAARAAMKEGYLAGGGTSIFKAYKCIKNINPDFNRMFKAVAEANIRQIAKNCGKNPDTILEAVENGNGNVGYNAATDKIENILKAGIIEPFLVTKQVISNAVSIANVILTSRYMIVNDLERDINKDNK